MPNPIAVTPSEKSLLDHPLCLPVKVALGPLHVVKRVFETVIGYFVRLGLFSFGEYTHSWHKRTVIRLFKGGLCDTAERAGFDPKRLEAAFEVCTNLGGHRHPIHTKDGLQLDSMLFRHSAAEEQIQQHGGSILRGLHICNSKTEEGKKVVTTFADESGDGSGECVDVILPDETKSGAEWEEFCKTTLGRVGLEKLVLQRADGSSVKGYIIKHWESSERLLPKKGTLFIRCNSPTESYAFGKRDIFRHVLECEADMLCFDYRGTWKSEGYPSEGGYYLDAEAAVDKALQYGYEMKYIWAEGFCLGSGVVFHLKRRYHEEGINLCTQNSFDKMENTLACQAFPANVLAVYGLPQVASRDPRITTRVTQDGFNNVGKLNTLSEKYGTAVLIHTDTDRTSHKDSMHRLHWSASKVCDAVLPILFEHPDQDKDGHSHDVLGERGVRHRYFEEVARRSYAG